MTDSTSWHTARRTWLLWLTGALALMARSNHMGQQPEGSTATSETRARTERKSLLLDHPAVVKYRHGSVLTLFATVV